MSSNIKRILDLVLGLALSSFLSIRPENMKKKVCLFVALASLLFSVYSQSVDRDYFRNNILDLDPIEGIYDAQVFGRSALAWRWQESSEKFMMSTTVVFVFVGKFL